MRKLLLTAALAATLPMGAAMAQAIDPNAATQVDTTTVVETQSETVPPVTYVAPSEANPSAAPGPDGILRQWGPQQAIVENAPAPSGSYPLCNSQRQDSCKNPDPSKELPYYPGEDRPSL